jgi:predicted SpoU family rRNA methylase
MNYIRKMKSDADKRIETVAQLVKAFGGTFALAKWADVVPSTVSNWKEQDAIPPGWHLRLYLECAQRKLNVAPKLFEIEDKPKTKAKPRRPSKRAEARFADAR